jgi:predicted nucleic acid-binding protein
MRTAVDTNVLSAIWGNERTAADVSEMLAASQALGSVVICGAVFAEALAAPRADEGRIRAFLEESRIEVDVELGDVGWTEAGRRYARYAARRRRSKQEAKRTLADFIIGAHALIHADRLMTLDRRRYERDFPELKLV